ncbi:MAG: hypothetical protein IJU79_04700 [Desulfovibrionaceae bacterium]|nr:hypothetical protein [Desulfovibrionaceae bacterium]
MLSRERPKLVFKHGRPPTTISLWESKAGSLSLKKNTAPMYLAEDIVCAHVKA